MAITNGLLPVLPVSYRFFSNSPKVAESEVAVRSSSTWLVPVGPRGQRFFSGRKDHLGVMYTLFDEIMTPLSGVNHFAFLPTDQETTSLVPSLLFLQESFVEQESGRG